MSFIDSTYFVGEINIPNLSANATVVSAAITQYEKEILIQLLGYKLYALLIADCTGEGGVPVTQKYIDLVNGAEFEHSFAGITTTLKWEGLKNSSKLSLIADYVFYKYVERDVTHLSGTGTIVVPSGKGFRASSVNKLCNAWERMRELYGTIPPEWKRFYPHLIPLASARVFNLDPSAYNFLYVNQLDYPDWIFTPQWNINAFGI